MDRRRGDKTKAEQTREALVLEETAREAAKERSIESGKGRQNFADPGKWSEDVGEQIGVSHETIRKGTDVFRMAYPVL